MNRETRDIHPFELRGREYRPYAWSRERVSTVRGMIGEIGVPRCGELGMNPSSAILVCDHDALFREALRNFLLAAGYAEVVIAATVREALTKLRCESYGHILIGISAPLSRGRRLARVARRRQPEAKILFFVSAQDQPLASDAAFVHVIKEYAFSNLLGLM